MSHQDSNRHTVSSPHHQALREALFWLIKTAKLGDLSFRRECRSTPIGFILTALLWSWSDDETLGGRFQISRKTVAAMGELDRGPTVSYQAFVKMLKTWTDILAVKLVEAFRNLMRTELSERFLIGGFAVFGVDGSRLELPRTISNQDRFASKSKRKKKTAQAGQKTLEDKKSINPQMWITTMLNVGVGLPWDWRIGPSNSSEREHLGQMLEALPKKSLVTADAGFVGYDCWKDLLAGGRHFLIRVGANVLLLKKLGYAKTETEDTVYLWPSREMSKNHPPLVLRLIKVTGGRSPVYLVTSIRDRKLLSDRQIIEIYALRWRIELFYRHFKQTFGRCKLRSRAAENAVLEVTWSLLGLWAMGLHARVQLAAEGIPPRRISVAQMLRAYRNSLRDYRSRPEPGESLGEMLKKAIIDPYKRRNKASRDYPRKKKFVPIGVPTIENAAPFQIRIARGLTHADANGLTA